MQNIQRTQLELIFGSSDGESFEVNALDLPELVNKLRLTGHYIAVMDIIANAKYRVTVRQACNNSEKCLD